MEGCLCGSEGWEFRRVGSFLCVVEGLCAARVKAFRFGVESSWARGRWECEDLRLGLESPLPIFASKIHSLKIH